MLNQCQFIGHLGADPEIKRMQSGKPVVNFNLAVTEKWKSKDTGERKERTEWIPAVIFSEGLCSIAEQYLRKGSKVMISGKFQTRSWEQDGVKRYKTEIVLQGFDAKLIMLDGPKSAPNDHGPEHDGHAGQGPIDDEIPFLAEWRV